MHGHGEKPFLCEYENCDRAVPGNGFPRHWNLRDHMRRVHNDSGVAKSSASGNSPPPAATLTVSARSKKRKHEKPTSVTMERSDKVVKSRSKKEPRDTTSEELYQQNFARLLASVQQLQDPRATDYSKICREVYGNFEIIQETALGMNAQHYLQE